MDSIQYINKRKIFQSKTSTTNLIFRAKISTQQSRHLLISSNQNSVHPQTNAMSRHPNAWQQLTRWFTQCRRRRSKPIAAPQWINIVEPSQKTHRWTNSSQCQHHQPNLAIVNCARRSIGTQSPQRIILPLAHLDRDCYRQSRVRRRHVTRTTNLPPHWWSESDKLAYEDMASQYRTFVTQTAWVSSRNLKSFRTKFHFKSRSLR